MAIYQEDNNQHSDGSNSIASYSKKQKILQPMESKHTKGNWNIETLHANEFPIYKIMNDAEHGERSAIATIYTATMNIKGEEAEANAKLISCAPDMAKMLSDEIKLLDRFMKMLPGKGIMWHEMKERKKLVKIVLDKATI